MLSIHDEIVLECLTTSWVRFPALRARVGRKGGDVNYVRRTLRRLIAFGFVYAPAGSRTESSKLIPTSRYVDCQP